MGEAESDPLLGLAPDDPVRLAAKLDEAFALRLSDRQRAAELNQELLELAEARGHLPSIARALFNLTLLFFTIGSLDELMQVSQRAYDIFAFLRDRSGMAAARDRQSTMAELAGDYGAALRYASEARELAQELGDRRREGWALSSLGGVHAALGEVELGRRYLDEGLRIFRELDDYMGLYRLHLRMSRLLREMGEYEEALALSKETFEWAQQASSDILIAVTISELGMIAEDRGDLDLALKKLETAYARFPAEFSSTVALETQIALGRVQLRRGDIAAARTWLEPLEKISMAMGSVPLELDLHRCLAEVYEQEGDPARALHHLKRFQSYRDQVFDAKSRREATRIQIRLRTEAAEKDAEIHRLRYVELEQLQSRLVETERLALLGDLAAGIAHEVNSPLGVLNSNLDLLQRSVRRLRGGDAPERIAEILNGLLSASGEATERIRSIVQSLQRFVRSDQGALQQVNLGEELESVLLLLQPMLPEDVVLLRRLEPVPSLAASASELNQALLTLLSHVAHQLGGPGQIEVSTLSDGDEVLIEVRDDGPALSPEQIEQLFRIRFGEEERRVRLQLGLAPVSAVVERHGGRLEVSSGVEGTCHRICLPIRSR
ncbi:MAG: tetratricopeptide repeat protein [Myxococcota bacterium]